jgi:hypothetical protein
MKCQLTVLLLFVSIAACSVLAAEEKKTKGQPTFPDRVRAKGLSPCSTDPVPSPSPRSALPSRKASTEKALAIGQFRELIAKAKTAPVNSQVPGGATRAPTATAVQKMAKKARFDQARETKHEIRGKDQTLTPASLQHVRSLADLRSGTHVLGRFHTESASKELKEGDYILVLVCEAGHHNVYAVRTDGTAVHQAKYLQVRHLGGQDKVPANEVHEGSFIFMMYYAMPHLYFPMSYPYFPMSYPYYPISFPYYGMSFEVVEILFYFP